MSLHLLGIRHHGPGSSKHVLDALETIKPDIILIEGPPEGEPMLSWVAHEDMKPPVALLAYVPDDPMQAVFYPFTDFSPEWNAIKYGIQHKIPVRFIDMPLVHKLVKEAPKNPETIENQGSEPVESAPPVESIRRNPISYFSEIAGFDDAEDWWEHQFEMTHHPLEVFEAIANMMTALRVHTPARNDRTEQIREAFMRRGIRTAQREMYSTIVVVCGAWHVPALAEMPTQKDDDALLKSLPKTKVDLTWIPWTSDRLSFESGYGAGVNAPGWYRHCWNHPKDDGSVWLSHSAQVFRAHKTDISSAHIIEAVRLSHALAALRGLSKPGLTEHNESTRTVMCMGDEILMQLIHKDLIVGTDSGQIPEGTPQVPLHRDFDLQCKRFRLKPESGEKLLSLDLREPNDLQKSRLLHRLMVLGVDWGHTQYARGKGTFKEDWNLRWSPEHIIKLIEKAAWGNTIEVACNQYVMHEATQCTQLGQITKLIQKVLPSELPEGVRVVMKRMDELAATTSDTALLMDAFLPLVQVSRYGNVRKTDLDTVVFILETIFYRIAANLPMSCTGIDEEQADTFHVKILEMNSAILLLDDEALKSAWNETIFKILGIQNAAPIIHGCVCKLLSDSKFMDSESTAKAFSKALSTGSDPVYAANWIEGFLKDNATTLILDDTIWDIINDWVATLNQDIFMQVIPLLRRSFAAYTSVEKRKIAEKAKLGTMPKVAMAISTRFDRERGEGVLPVLGRVMGLVLGS